MLDTLYLYHFYNLKTFNSIVFARYLFLQKETKLNQGNMKIILKYDFKTCLYI